MGGRKRGECLKGNGMIRRKASGRIVAGKVGVSENSNGRAVEPPRHPCLPLAPHPHPLFTPHPSAAGFAESYATGENTRLAFLSRTREDIMHPYWLPPNPYSVLTRHPIRRPLAGPKSRVFPLTPARPHPPTFSSFDTLYERPMRLAPLSHGAPLQCISPPALSPFARRIFLNKCFFNKRWSRGRE
ncbi:hypothetical protein X777_11346 [Ooceraea biroi]|uniref:Uncharacterized protein n=1 Tax=Ooceraea biroi TaxID=2015173 RepID=A0A026WXE1_OOCBI|nr:hypothetical protein X777_11346 [Ooceraea biroi]